MKVLCGTLILFLAAAAIAVSAGTTVVIMRSAGATSGCTSAGSDAFTSDPQSGSDWNTDLEEDGTGFTWDSTAENEINTASGSGIMNALTYTATAASSSNMWVKAKITTIAGAGNFGLTLRRSTSGGGRYVVKILAANITWQYWSGNGGTGASSLSSASTGCGTIAAGDVISAYVTGTGNDTVLKVWKNPSGSTPTDWGDANACISFTDDPISVVDSGTYGGMYGATTNATRRTMVIDDFSVGGCT